MGRFTAFILFTLFLSGQAFASDSFAVAELKTAPQVVQTADGSTLEVRGNVTIIRLGTSPSPNTLTEAIAKIRDDLASVRKANPQVHTEILFLQPTSDAFPRSTVLEISDAAGWGNTRSSINNTLRGALQSSRPAERRRWTEALELYEQMDPDHRAYAFMGLVPTNNLRTDLTFTIVRTVAIAGAVTWSLVMSQVAGLTAALPVGIAAGLMSGLLMLKNTEVAKWTENKGYLKPSSTERAPIAESAIKNWLISLGYYSVVDFVKGGTGIRSNILAQLLSPDYLAAMRDFVSGPLTLSVVSLLSENVAGKANAALSRRMMTEFPEKKEQIALASKKWALGLSLIGTTAFVLKGVGFEPANAVIYGISSVGFGVITFTYLGLHKRMLEALMRASRWLSERAALPRSRSGSCTALFVARY